MLRPLLLLAVPSWFRVHVVLVRLTQQLHVIQSLELPALVLVDLSLLVALLLLLHFVQAGGAEVCALHHAPVARLLLLVLVSWLALLLTGRTPPVLGPDELRAVHQDLWPLH